MDTFVTLKDGEITTVGVVSTPDSYVIDLISGPAGPRGTQGPQGNTGSQGPMGPAGPVAGSNTQVVFNDSGVANGSPGLTFNKLNNTLTIGSVSINSTSYPTTTVINLGNVAGVIPTSSISYTKNGLYEMTATGDINFPDPIIFTAGVQVDLFVTQDTNGSHAITFGTGGIETNFVTRTGDALSTTPGATDIVSISVASNGDLIVRISNGVVLAPTGVTYTTSNFTVPAVGYTVTVNVGNGTSYQNGAYVLIPGSPNMYGFVSSGGGTNSLTIQRVYAGSNTSGYTISSGAIVGFSGYPGANGTNGAKGAGATVTTADVTIGTSGQPLILPCENIAAFYVGQYIYVYDIDTNYYAYGYITAFPGGPNITMAVLASSGAGLTLTGGATQVTFAGLPGSGATTTLANASITSTTTLNVLNGTAFAAGSYLYATDKTNYIQGKVYSSSGGSYGSTNLVVNTYSSSGSTLSSGATVTFSGIQGPTGTQGPPGSGGGASRMGTISNYASTSKLLAFTAYKMVDSTGAAIINVVSMASKTIASTWSAGTGGGLLDTGSVAINTTYHIYVICKSDLSGGDYICSTNATSPVLPAGYSGGFYVRIGSLYTDASSNWVMFTQRFNRFILGTPVKELAAVTGNTAVTTQALTSVPNGVRIKPRTKWNGSTVNISIGTVDDNMVSAATFGANYGYDTTGATGVAEPDLLTDTSRQIKFVSSANSGTVTCWCFGWEDVGLLWGT